MRIIELCSNKKAVTVTIYFAKMYDSFSGDDIYNSKINNIGHFINFLLVMRKYNNVHERIKELIYVGNNTKTLNDAILIIVKSTEDLNYIGYHYILSNEFKSISVEEMPTKIQLDGANVFSRSINLTVDASILQKIDNMIELFNRKAEDSNITALSKVMTSIRSVYIDTGVITTTDMLWINKMRGEYDV